MWGNKGYTREVPPVAIATPSTVIATPQQVESVVGDSERERERERGGEDKRSDMEARENTSSRPLTAVSVQSLVNRCYGCMVHVHVWHSMLICIEGQDTI